MSMKGRNRLVLNQATMCEAIRTWLRATTFVEDAAAAVGVTEVKPIKEGSVTLFEVVLTSPVAEEEEV